MHSIGRRKLLPIAWALCALTPASAHATDPPERLSQAPVDVDAAWLEPGFRMQLRFAYERLQGNDAPAPATPAFALSIEPAYRLNERFSLGLGLRYSVLLGTWSGLRWNTTADVVWHPVDGGSLGVGAGYGGLQGERVEYDVDYDEQGSYVVNDDDETSRLRTCDGNGAIVLVRAGYVFALGDLFATGPVLQMDLQRTRCRGDDFGGDSRTEVWWQPGWQLSWAFTWR
jgi:hypothetical protein